MSSGKVKTFYPSTPVDFSSSLIQQLDSESESNYTRQQYSQIYIQKEVNKSLKQLETQELSKFEKNLSFKSDDLKNGSVSGKDELSVDSLNEKLNKINEHLTSLNNQLKQSDNKPKELTAAESTLTSCLKNNKGKILNCWNEFESFKKLAKDL